MLPKKPTGISVEVREHDRKVFIRLISSDGGNMHLLTRSTGSEYL
jgi:hypothetical protein